MLSEGPSYPPSFSAWWARRKSVSRSIISFHLKSFAEPGMPGICSSETTISTGVFAKMSRAFAAESAVTTT